MTSLAHRLQALVHERIDDPDLCADALADALGVSRATLYRRLRDAGTTPFAVVREARMVRAAELLRAGVTVAEAGETAGYTDLSAFSRAFRRHHGVPPSAWPSRSSP